MKFEELVSDRFIRSVLWDFNDHVLRQHLGVSFYPREDALFVLEQLIRASEGKWEWTDSNIKNQLNKLKRADSNVMFQDCRKCNPSENARELILYVFNIDEAKKKYEERGFDLHQVSNNKKESKKFAPTINGQPIRYYETVQEASDANDDFYGFKRKKQTEIKEPTPELREMFIRILNQVIDRQNKY